MGDLAPLLSGGGVFGVLGLVILWLLRGNRDSLGQAEERIDNAERRADEADKRREAVERLLDAERAERRRIEDEFSARIRTLEGKVEELTREIRRLRTDREGSL